MQEIEAQYLVVGAGAGGMAFVDTLLSSSPTASVVLVDSRDAPGGHWVDAYPFVRLHQPANAYGVESRRLEDPNKADLATNLSSKPEILAYYLAVLERFLSTGRVHWFPSCTAAEDWTRSRSFSSLAQPGLSWRVQGARCVDAAYSRVTVPSTARPNYAISPGAPPVVPVNMLGDLKAHRRPVSRYIVVGAGKTGIDAVLHLLSRHVRPESIRWIMPRDSWMFDRRFHQGLAGVPLAQILDTVGGTLEATTVDEYYAALQRGGMLFALDPAHPTIERNRGAQVTLDDVAALRTLVSAGSVVRKGRVVRVEPERLVLERGELALPEDALIVDASADGLTARPPQPVFTPEVITLQALQLFLMPISGAVTARVEAMLEDEKEKNRLTTPVPHPVTARDFLVCQFLEGQNRDRWRAEPKVASWYRRCRLNWREAHPPPMLSTLRQIAYEWRRVLVLHNLEQRSQDKLLELLDKSGGRKHSIMAKL